MSPKTADDPLLSVDRQAAGVADRLDDLRFDDWEVYAEAYEKRTAALDRGSSVERGAVDRFGIGIRVAAAGGGTVSAYTSSTDDAELGAVLAGLQTSARLAVAPNDDALPTHFPAAGTTRDPAEREMISEEETTQRLASSVGDPDRLVVSELTRRVVIRRRGFEAFRDFEYELGATTHLHLNERDMFYPTVVAPIAAASFAEVADRLADAIVAYPPVGVNQVDADVTLPDMVVLHPSVVNAVFRTAIRLAGASDFQTCDFPDWVTIRDEPTCPGSTTQRHFDDVGGPTTNLTIVGQGQLQPLDTSEMARRRHSYRAQPRPGGMTMTLDAAQPGVDVGIGTVDHVWIDGIHFSESAIVRPTDTVSGPVEGWVVRNGRPELLHMARMAVPWSDLAEAIVATFGPRQNTGTKNNAYVAPLILDGSRLPPRWLQR